MTTSRFPLRGLAALCLLCVLPRLGATVVQVGTINASDWGDGNQRCYVGGNWLFDLHDPAAGPLHSASLEIEISVTASIFERSFYSVPMVFAPSANFVAYFGLFSGPAQDLIHLSSVVTSQHLATPFILEPNKSKTVMHTITQRLTYTADAAALAGLTGPGSGRLFLMAYVEPYTDHGSVFVTGATTARLTFNVPDENHAPALLALSLGALIALRRKLCLA